MASGISTDPSCFADTIRSGLEAYMTPTFSILHATARTRPDGWSASREAWMLNADEPGKVEYVLAVHVDDCRETTPCIAGHTVIYDGARNSVHGWNAAAEHSTGQILILNADDFFPPAHWGSLLLDKVAHTPLGDEFAIHVSTGNPDVAWDRKHMALGIISRALYQRWGYALYPGYESMYSDVDMFEHARQEDVIIPAYDLLFEHRHVAFGKSPDDEVYRRQNRPEAYALGREVMERRRLERFSK